MTEQLEEPQIVGMGTVRIKSLRCFRWGKVLHISPAREKVSTEHSVQVEPAALKVQDKMSILRIPGNQSQHIQFVVTGTYSGEVNPLAHCVHVLARHSRKVYDLS